MMLEVMMCSKTVQQMQVRDISFWAFLVYRGDKCIFPVSRDYTFRERGIIDVGENWSNFNV